MCVATLEPGFLLQFAQDHSGVTRENIQPYSTVGVYVFPQKPFIIRIFVVSPMDGLHFHFPGNGASLLALRITPKVVEGEPRGNNRTNLRKGDRFSISREGSLTDI